MKEILRLSHIKTSDSEIIDFNMSINKGEIMALLGDFYSGKEIIKEIIRGKQEFCYGSIFIEEEKVHKYDRKKAEERVFYIDVEADLVESMSISENISILTNKTYFKVLSNVNIENHTKEILNYIGINSSIKEKI